MPNSPILLDYEPVSYKKEITNFLYKIPPYLKQYFIGLLPVVQWIYRYNLTWLVSDIIAGVTVGIVAVPQGMGYAKIANLEPQYGLYSSFVGLCLYFFFGTSKDISIGPTAVMSLLVGQTVTRVTATGEYTGPQVAVILALFGGFIALFIGLARLGILVDFIPHPAIAGFMTGSSLTISIGQWPKLFGMKSVNTHDSAYLIFGNFFKYLPETRVDAAFGLIGLLWLYSIRYGTAYLTKKYPHREKWFFFLNIMRNGILVIFGTLIAFLVNIGKTASPISILKTVPSGFTAMAVPEVDINLLSQVTSTLPSVVIILILEHVAIAKSFGRINNYKIDADQEIFAIGAANVIGSFFGAYPNTGSFSRTAITARSGARTPLTGVFSALVVLLCLYALTPAFYYIPDAILSAVIIHAVADLVSGPKFLIELYHVSPFELFTFIAAVLITFFTTVEYGIYVSVCLSIAFMLIRIARPRYSILGRIPVQPTTSYYDPNDPYSEKGHIIVDNDEATINEEHFIYVRNDHPTLNHLVQPPPPGVVIFRFDESLTYPNAGFLSDKIMHYIQDNFTSGSPPPTTKGERAWNDRRPLAKKPESDEEAAEQQRQREEESIKLRAIVLDCSAINHLDSTGIQTLLDLKLSINRYAGHEVEWHFANIATPWIRNALINSGFGSQAGRGPRNGEILPVVPLYQEQQCELNKIPSTTSSSDSCYVSEKIEMDAKSPNSVSTENTFIFNIDGKGRVECIPRYDRGHPIDRYPFFHWDLEDAVRAVSYTLKKESN